MTSYPHPVPQRICCIDCGKNYVLKTRILPENHAGKCAACGQPTESLGRIA